MVPLLNSLYGPLKCPEEVGVVWRSRAQVLSLQAQADLSFWRLFWKHDLSLVCGALLSNYSLLFLRVVVGTTAARPRNSGIQMSAQCWCSERARLTPFQGHGLLLQRGVPVCGKGGAEWASPGWVLNVSILDLHVCGQLCVDHIVHDHIVRQTGFVQADCRVRLTYLSSLIVRTGRIVDGIL